MKKLIVLLLTFLGMFMAVVPVAAEERWTDGSSEFEVQRTGNSIIIKTTTPRESRPPGIVVLSGTITGTTFTGTQHLIADECPGLDHDEPANGTVTSDGSITVTFLNNNYDTAECVDLPGTEHEDSATYSIAVASTPKPSPSADPITPDLTDEEKEELACHEGCQANFDVCIDQCDEQLPVPQPTPEDPQACRDRCQSEYDAAYSTAVNSCFDTKSTCADGITNRKNPDGSHPCWGTAIDASPCYGEIQQKCDAPYKTCVDEIKLNKNTCLDKCDLPPPSPPPDCETACRETKSSCDSSCWETRQVRNQSKPSTKPQIGLSSKDFAALVDVMNKLQVAQADLDRLKADQKFSDKYNAQLDQVSQTPDVPPKDYLQAARRVLEWVRDAATTYKNADKLQKYLDNGKFGAYNQVSFITDVGNGLIAFMDMVGAGVSVDDAATKAAIDTAAPSLFTLFPPLKLADMIANIPDAFLALFGIPKNNPVRIVTGFLSKNSPKAFVKITTSAMIKTGNWTNVGGAIGVAFDDFRNAQGFGEKLEATVGLVGTVVGAVPVAIVMNIRDNVSTVFTGFKTWGNMVSNVSGWLTSSW
ncbi:MAG: hypothetical protein UV61_C0002G0057 [Candidatus Gottesmanbacteria bacterium GW2011_GWB1_43_11]|uniref:Uncharacterized protein n=1 Tax=Candidatus Gottesmanbacteria bacterium GW2011_GWB1_43_11 TaxID=1618446 RepID=A0A0G1EWD5_9BACT|nr:MAG: hypothetical protein UV04_C0020G0016 [Candidatus Gottesmanbacteria bacterium GW2011_GWA2_42_16]KKS81857.1 MAG: hypothetical protein UV55_C0008G0072 [Candidatus Gottesmanbacteria bacterium GW2011_GWC1_43_10]KKS87336.1 MAG: hypothetical protein UV61_C0002G0057 [Candidatus Gottesmanbacteria bacterium GW2011_GWB1_43_11]HCM37507.1 hypothetical protein [Patescibacteria group bacterium]